MDAEEDEAKLLLATALELLLLTVRGERLLVREEPLLPNLFSSDNDKCPE